MRVRFYAAAAAVALLGAPMTAFALPTGWHPPSHRHIAAAREEARQNDPDRPCHVVSNNPHESLGLQALQRNCQRLHAQMKAHPEDAASRDDCARAAEALAGQPC